MGETDYEWFQKQASIEKEYDILYAKPNLTVKISLFYVKNNTIVFTLSERQPLHNSLITRNELEHFIMKHRRFEKSIYGFHSMATYNISITPKQIVEGDYSSNYFTQMSRMKDVDFEDTISYLEEDNELFIVLYEKDNQLNTRRHINHSKRKTQRKNN